MSYYTQSFDTAHNLAHVLKDVGYCVNIIALTVSGIRYTINLKERNELIQDQYEKIKESEKIKDEFIKVAAHELRTSIQPILALSIFLVNKEGEIEEYKNTRTM
jgi:signal transduction histidine kinase